MLLTGSNVIEPCASVFISNCWAGSSVGVFSLDLSCRAVGTTSGALLESLAARIILPLSTGSLTDRFFDGVVKGDLCCMACLDGCCVRDSLSSFLESSAETLNLGSAPFITFPFALSGILLALLRSLGREPMYGDRGSFFTVGGGLIGKAAGAVWVRSEPTDKLAITEE